MSRLTSVSLLLSLLSVAPPSAHALLTTSSGPTQSEGAICLNPAAADCSLLTASGLTLDEPLSVFAVARAVPEPFSLILLGLGLLGFGLRRRMRRATGRRAAIRRTKLV